MLRFPLRFWPMVLVCCAAQALAWQWRLPGHYAPLLALNTGLALVLLLRYGRRYWAGPALAACVWPLLAGMPLLATLLLSLIATAQAVLTVTLLPQLRRGGELRVYDGLRFLAVGPLAAAGLTAGCGIVLVYFFERTAAAGLWAQWLLWWWSEALAMLVAVALYYGRAFRRRNRQARIELGLLLAAAAMTALLIYYPPWPGLGDLQFLLFPLMVWAALRVGLFGVGLVGAATAVAAAISLHLGQAGVPAALPAVTLLVAVMITGLLLALSNREGAMAARETRLASQVFQNASEGILITDANARIVAVNPAFSRITGFTAKEAIGRISRMFGSRGSQRLANRDMLQRLSRDGYWQGEMLDRRKNGEAYPAWLSISAVRDEHGTVSNYVGVFSDYTNRKEAEQRLHFLANHDALTRLYNRTAMHEALGQAVTRASEEHRQLAVLFIDLDRFKAINDTLGHDVGDELLKVIAQRLRASLKESDLIARLGGDEFTVLLDNVHQVDDVAHVSERLLTELCKPIVIQGQELFVTCSIGISLYPGDGLQPAQLLKNADVAMYRAKELGKNNYQFFSPDMNARAFEHLVLENSLRYALERRELILHFQPQIDIVSGELEGVEALIRWEHPELGLIPPSSFIPLAEENGLIVPIGEWVLQESCRMLKLWQVAGYMIPRMAINLSARQFLREQLPQQVAAALASYEIPPQRIELEITESMIMQNPQRAVSVLGELRAMGVKLAIDDFGTGYSSLSNLKHFPLDTLKIDRSFIVGVPEDEDSAAIAEAIVAMAKKLRLKVVAEGVETIQQMLFMRRSGCHAVQGYLYAMPLDADGLLRYLAREGYAAAGAADADA
ncbi:EAL domain-containing protein [Chitiniphilus purpureus]|uniref:EAL domain-containing protein n=1 Tax=Chitiniphilus purpureus TaxID=2981137 RepID=A0ABY6DI93_9NEIS|nr:EAL domain-containing protein [Chitiniphilus sp. CD1]UXY14065.1 EAL domain-containing protein [Chitiniphilus sp. CD1]